MHVPADVAREMARVAARARGLAAASTGSSRPGRQTTWPHVSPNLARRKAPSSSPTRRPPGAAGMAASGFRRRVRDSTSPSSSGPERGDAERKSPVCAADARQRRGDRRGRSRRDGTACEDQMAERRRWSGARKLAGILGRVRRYREARSSTSCSASASTCDPPRIRPSSPRVTTSIEAETSRPADRAIDASPKSLRRWPIATQISRPEGSMLF